MVTKVQAPTTWYNYLYMFPDNTVFYVGKGRKGRIDEHEKEAQTGCSCEKCKTIRFIWKCRQPVKKRIVFETLVEAEALDNEKRLIVQHASEFLTNIVHNRCWKEAKVKSKKNSFTFWTYSHNRESQGRMGAYQKGNKVEEEWA